MKNKIRLPHHIKPENYRLLIKPDLDGFTFEGEEAIDLKVEKAVFSITLHSKDLKIWDVNYIHKSQKQHAKKVEYNLKAETATLFFSSRITAGIGQLSLKFRGILNDKMRGFYRSKYSHGGQEKYLATTQFEATDARRAFPCFDEPAHKASFDVTIMTPKGLTVISNTIESSISEHHSGYQLVKFEPTPKMSTYLLAFIVGDFEFLESKTKRGVKVRVFVTPGKKHQAKFALKTAIKALEFYEKYFNINYPLPVLDMIAIPDFNSAAMENWGAITYRESAILVDEKNSSLSNKQWVAIVIAHEIAHQWFGNLVTMEWWTHLWLNEGFASYMEYLCVDKLFPKWKIWQQYVAERFNTAMELDALSNTHPIEVEVHHPEEISEIFDAVSYAKGSVVIRMLAEYLGERQFRDGLRYYLKKHSYQNTSTIHLWEAFEKVSKKPVTKIMRGWTEYPGYPLIEVKEQNNNVVLNQLRYFSSSLSKTNNKIQGWKIPLTYCFGGKKTAKILFEGKSVSLPYPKKTWLKLNYGETGLFRVNYPAAFSKKFYYPIKNKVLKAPDRLGIIRDAFALAESGKKSTIEALELAEQYQNEADYNVWVILATGLYAVEGIMRNTKSYKEYKKFCLNLFEQILKKTKLKAKKGEDSSQTFLRSLILQQAIRWEHGPTIAKLRGLFKNKPAINVNLRSVVYYAAAKFGDIKTHNKFVELYIKEPLQAEKDRLARALTLFSDPHLLKKTLDFAFSEHVKDQDAPFILAAVLKNPAGADLGLDYAFKNWSKLLNKYSAGLSMISRIVGAMDNFYSENKANEIENFFIKHKTPGATRAVKQTLEKIRSQASWLKRDGEKLEKYLENNV